MHRVCRLPFMPCLFLRLMELLDRIVSKLNLRSYVRPTSTCIPPPCTLALLTFDSNNLVTDRDSHALAWFFRALARIIRQPSFGCVLWTFVPSLYFFLIFHFPCIMWSYPIGLKMWIIFWLASRGKWVLAGGWCYIYIRLSLFIIDLLLQLKISYELTDFYVINRYWMWDCYVCIYDL